MRDRDSEDCAAAERAFAQALGGGCSQPVAAHAVILPDHEAMKLTGFYRSGAPRSLTGPRGEGRELGLRLAQMMQREAIL